MKRRKGAKGRKEGRKKGKKDEEGRKVAIGKKKKAGN